MFQLPEFQRLTEEQKKAYDLPLKGIHLIVGPPGSGKTVIALYRSQMLAEAGSDYRFLVYNNTLMQYLTASLGSVGIRDRAATFYRWFKTWYRSIFNQDPPEKEAFQFDWMAITSEIVKGKKLIPFPHMILDEGQDFGRDFYATLPIFFENATVFADENQRLSEHNSTIDDIRANLVIDNPLELTKNFRNTYQIARFAARFYTGLPTGIPELPDRQGNLPKIFTGLDWGAEVDQISRYAKTWRNKHIGVFLLTQNQVRAFRRSLCEKAPGIDIQMYLGNDPNHAFLDFSKPGIKVLCYSSTKGLEFNTVFIPLLRDWHGGFTDDRKMQFYVLCSRAREDLYLLAQDDHIPNFLANIPADLYSLNN